VEAEDPAPEVEEEVEALDVDVRSYRSPR